MCHVKVSELKAQQLHLIGTFPPHEHFSGTRNFSQVPSAGTQFSCSSSEGVAEHFKSLPWSMYFKPEQELLGGDFNDKLSKLVAHKHRHQHGIYAEVQG